MASGVNQVEEEKTETADIIMIGPPLGGQESDLENENDDSLCVDDLPNEVSCKLEVLSVHNEDLSDNGNDYNVETTAPPTSKKINDGKPHKAMTWEKKNLNPKATSKPHQDKTGQALLPEHSENVGLPSGHLLRKYF